MARSYITLNNHLPTLQAPDPWGGNRPATIVGDGFTSAQSYASVSFNTAQAYIANLADIAAAAADLPTISAELDAVASSITAFATPDLPVRPDGLGLSIPDAPTPPVIGSVDAVDTGDAPTFDAVAPAINTGIVAPDALSLTIPDAPTLRDPVFPEQPALDTLAAVDTLTLPDQPVFTAVRPDTNLDIAPPTAFEGALPTPPVVSDPVFPDAPQVPDVSSISGITVGDAPIYAGVAPTLNLDAVKPEPPEINLPAAPAVADPVWFDAPAAPVIGQIAAVNVGTPPELTADAPVTNFDIAKPEPLDLTFPTPPVVADAVIPDAPGLPAVQSVDNLLVADAPVFAQAAPVLDFSITPPAPVTVELPAVPPINDVALPEAPGLPVVDTVSGLSVSDAPTFDQAAPVLNFDLSAPDPVTVQLPTAPAVNDVSLPEAPALPIVSAIAPLVVGDAPTFTASPPEQNFDIAAPSSFTPTLPEAPVIAGITVPDAPAAPTLEAVDPLDAGVAPEFTAVAPVLNLDIAPPSPLAATIPVAPALDAVAIPDAPDLVLPDAPTLREIEIPPVPELTLPTFDATIADPPTVPDVSFAWGETPYASALLDQLKAKLQEWVGGASTGLEAVVEEAIWNRMRDREQRSAAQTSADVLRQFAVRGFNRPPGAVAIALQRAMQVLNDNTVSASREIAIQQAQLEQTNRQFAFTTALNVESTLINYTSQIAGRALDAAKFAAQIGLEVFQAEVVRYQADITAFQARAEVFKALLQAELARLEIFRAQIEAQKLVGEVNQQDVAIYTARIGGVQALIELFRSRVQAAQATADVQRTIIQAYATETQAYGEQVRAKAAEYDAYATQIRAEVSKAETFKVEADAFSSRVQGFTAILNARTAEKTSEIDIKQRLPLELFKARTEGFRNIIAGLQTATETDRTRVQSYTAQVSAQGELTRARAVDVDIYRAEIDAEKSKAETFRLQADAFGRQVDAYRALTDALVAQKNIEIKVGTEVPIEVNKAAIAIYDASLRGAQSEIETARTRVQAYSAEVSAQGELTRARALDVDVYKARVDAERAKADTFKLAAEAFGKQIDAYKAVVDAAVQQKNIEIKLATEIPIEVNKQAVAIYDAGLRGAQTQTETDRTRVQAYSAEVAAQGERTRARALDLDSYKAQIEAERAKAETFKLAADAFGKQVDAYKATVDALVQQKNIEVKLATEVPIEVTKAAIASYDASLRGIQIQSDKDKSRVQAYSAELESLNTLVRARGVDVEVYKASIEAEKSKADTYRIEVDAYGKQVDAFKALTDALIQAKNIEVKLEAELPIEVAKANIAAFDASLRGAANRIEVDRTRVQAFGAEVQAQAEITRAKSVEVEVYKAGLEGERIKAEAYKTDVEAFSAQVTAYKNVIDALTAAKNIDIKIGVELPIEVSKARIAVYDAALRASQTLADVQRTNVQAYSAQVDAFGKTIQAKGLENDIYRTRVEAEKSKADLYRVDTEAYRAQVEAFDALIRGLVAAKNSEIDVTQKVPIERMKAEVELFRAALSSVDTTVRADGLQIERYKAELDGVQRLIEAHRNTLDTYRASLDGEKLKTDIYRTEAEAFNSLVNGYRARVEALIAASNQQIKINAELPIDLYRAQAQGYDSVVRAEAARLNALAGTYETDGRVFESLVRGEAARMNAEADVYKADTDRVTKFGEIRLEAAKANLQRAQQQIKLLADAITAGAQMSAQIAAAALSVINLSGGMSASESYNTSVSTNNSNSDSYSNSDNYTEVHSYNET